LNNPAGDPNQWLEWIGITGCFASESATIASGGHESSRLRTSDGLYSMRKAEDESPAKKATLLTLALDTQHGIYRDGISGRFRLSETCSKTGRKEDRASVVLS
jgi:hypothetical protein